ncbi:uncharacterized protein LOC123302535 [Chrysoperla carnea]|uniref:uncharacterized protein LOC123302535 n=1 Tax=Chrysoperla carnea TaxID=189513 RepID=UPI001D071B0A|nr:uncharacterized protein LOC123302535 [Chrysoperla carnea]
MQVIRNFRIIIMIFLIHSVVGEPTYCESGLCQVNEYCCGENDCCAQSMDNWFLWFGVLLIIIALAIGCMIRGFCSRYKMKNYQYYTQLQKNNDEDLVNNLYKAVPGSV